MRAARRGALTTGTCARPQAEAIKNEELASEIELIENEPNLDAREGRRRMREAIEKSTRLSREPHAISAPLLGFGEAVTARLRTTLQPIAMGGTKSPHPV